MVSTKMQDILVVRVIFSLVILSNCLLFEARSLYAMDPSQTLVSKRSMERRGFVKSFCARRCNIGKGGNICRCNGFHFAGKRTSKSAVNYRLDDMLGEQMPYKILLGDDSVHLRPDHVDRIVPENLILSKIESLLPRVMGEDSSVYEPVYQTMQGYYEEDDV